MRLAFLNQTEETPILHTTGVLQLCPPLFNSCEVKSGALAMFLEGAGNPQGGLQSVTRCEIMWVGRGHGHRVRIEQDCDS